MSPRPWTSCARWAGAAATAVVLLALGGGFPLAQGETPAIPRCTGAAARVPGHPCINPALARRVVPSPSGALLVSDAPCTPHDTAPGRILVPCAFGPAAKPQAASVALLGDSHAAHWRAALARAAAAAGWHGESLTRSSCQFAVHPRAPANAAQAACRKWNVEVVRWFTDHPEVHTVFVSAYDAAGVIPEPGRTAIAIRVRDVTAAWARLPATVRHVIVLRDIPGESARTRACVEDVLTRHLVAAAHCAVARRFALRPDPLVLAAQRIAAARVQVVDLTPFLCSPRRCFPVVGGILVERDDGHLTRAFSATLGPYLLRAARGLVR